MYGSLSWHDESTVRKRKKIAMRKLLKNVVPVTFRTTVECSIIELQETSGTWTSLTPQTNLLGVLFHFPPLLGVEFLEPYPPRGDHNSDVKMTARNTRNPSHCPPNDGRALQLTTGAGEAPLNQYLKTMEEKRSNSNKHKTIYNCHLGDGDCHVVSHWYLQPQKPLLQNL